MIKVLYISVRTAICLSMPINMILTVFIMLVELNLLRNVDANNTENSTTVKNSSLLSGFRGGSSYNHETETIFALPRMQLDFKSIHVQEPQEPSLQAIFPPRILSTRPGQKSPVIIHDENSSDKDREDSITYTTVDWRDFMCKTWHLEPTLR
ncbi:hypothetical protein Celaphus_00000477 [Cervus elaphus hippelaphus]|uniref:Bridge-like lipid transfer protein family member 1 C-terminal domain-containing protein n=1 Tax=Cervus elaphus hippelaphus TaxID=46360 RepID=A0A212D7N5_CEREH|nr:hypothetical protein Celaphus_00000477 [Cervus elaphus hippelaphus]